MGESRTVASISGLPPPLDRQLQICHRAAELFAKRSFGQVSMRELATHLGIQAGSLYHHFESKESLLFELIEALYHRLLKNAQYQSSRYGTPQAKLKALVQAHIALHEQLGAYFEVTEHELRNLCHEYQQRIHCLRHGYEQHFLDLLAETRLQTPLLRAAVQSMVSILNNLPAWLEQTQLSKAERLRFMTETALALVTKKCVEPIKARQYQATGPVTPGRQRLSSSARCICDCHNVLPDAHGKTSRSSVPAGQDD